MRLPPSLGQASIYRQILLHALHFRSNLVSRRVLPVLLAVAIIASSLMAIPSVKITWYPVVLSLLGLLTFLWWNNFINSIMRQANFAQCHVVPQLRSCLMWMVIAMWVALALLFATVASIALGKFFWILSASGFGLVLIALTIMFPWLAFLYFFPSILLMLEGTWIAQVWFNLGTLVQCGLFAVSTLVLGSYAMRRILAPASDRLVAGSSIAKPQTPIEEFQAVTRLIATPHYLRSLHRAIHAGHPGGLLMAMVRPATLSNMWSAGVVFAGMATGGMYLAPVERDDYVDFMSWMVINGSCVLIFALRLVLDQTQQEQRMLRLSPLIPRGRDLNRLLGRRLLLWGANGLAANLVVVTVLALVAGSDLSRLIDIWSRCCAFLLPFGFVLADYSGDYVAERKWKIAGAALLALAMVGVFAWAGWPWPLLGLLNLSLLSALLWRRWALMMVAPVAFPTGRNASRPMKSI